MNSNESTEELPARRIAVSGAAGAVGYSLIFRIAAGAMLGPDQPIDLRLLERPSHLRMLQATQMEMVDCAFPLIRNLLATDDPREAFADADWIILLACGNREQPVPNRLEALKKNGSIYVEHGRAINQVARAARILVVASPCNANCMAAMTHAPNIPVEHWFALNRVERMRATAMLAEKAGVPVKHINRVIVWGNRGDLLYTDYNNAYIDERPIRSVVHDQEWCRTTLQAAVVTRSTEIFQRRGSWPAATASQAILGTIHSLTTPTPYGRRFGAGVVSDGSYNVPKGLIFGLPLRTENGRDWSIVSDLYLDEFAQECIARNVAELEHEAVLTQQLFG